ncbi:response regulator [Rapidithrix thailandica]|uniref:Response regulator n=1 Tax=Rapidithrix thailandica TaxID=413964 RepID=A0AAW9RXP1_9BACT
MDTLAVVDDNEVVHFIIDEIVKKYQLAKRLLPFLDGESAIEFFKTACEEQEALPDLLLLDINLPGLDGWDFLEEFAKIQSNLKKELTIYMLSSSINEQDMEKAAYNPFVSGYVTKPVTAEKLKNLLEAK